MPCVSYTDAEYREADRRDIERLQHELDQATRLLCEACRVLPPVMGSEADGWWRAHQEKDRKREQAEREAEAKRQAEQAEIERRRAEASLVWCSACQRKVDPTPLAGSCPFCRLLVVPK